MSQMHKILVHYRPPQRKLRMWLSLLVVVAQVVASFSAAAAGVIQPAALAPLVGTPKVVQAAAPLKVEDAKPQAIKSANAAPVRKPAFAALTTQSTITGVVFHDVNGNGINNSEAGIAGATVTALCATGSGPDNILGGDTGNSQDDVYTTYTATTGASGQYSFTNVAGWPCRIFLSMPSGYYAGPHGADSQGPVVLAPAVDNNGNPILGSGSGGNLSGPPATFSTTINFGLVQASDTNIPTEFTGLLWGDGDNDGVMEPGEPDWSGVPVKLYDPNGNLVASAVTGNDGKFYFSSATGTDTTTEKFGLTLSPNTTGYKIVYDITTIASLGAVSGGRGVDRCFSSSGVVSEPNGTGNPPKLVTVDAANPVVGLSHCNNAGLGHSPAYQYDFGDAPDSYHTSSANNGAYEKIDLNSHVQFLGPCVTADATNQSHDGAPFDVDYSAALPSVNADGDDKHSSVAGCSQDDGVTFSPMVPGQDMVITLTAPSRYTTLYLNAWFDWNGNGVFDSNERVIDGGFAGSGCDFSSDGGNTRPGALNFYNFATTPVTRIIHVPSNVTLAPGAPGVYSRFRVNTTCYTTPPDGPGPNGFGEVEDYVTAVPSLMGTIKLVKQTTGGDGTFTFTGSDASLNQSVTTANGTGGGNVSTLAAGTYTITEDALAGWNTTGINITGDTNNNSMTDVGNRQAIVHLDAGENITVTYGNTKASTPSVCTATTLHYAVNFPQGHGNFDSTKTLPQFDPALGTLLSVAVTGTAAISDVIKVENLEPSISQSITGTVTGTVSLADPVNPLINISRTLTTGSISVLPYDGATDYGGADSAMFPPVRIGDTQTKRFSTASQMAPYIGTGTVPFALSTRNGEHVEGTGNFASLILTYANGTVALDYCYNPAPPTSTTLIVRKAAPTINNCAAITGAGISDPNPANNSSCVSASVVPTNAIGVNFNFTDTVAMTPGGVLTPTFALQMGQVMTFTSVISGAYTVTETKLAGWQLANATCSNGEAPQNVHVPTGMTVTCTFTNTQATAQFGDRVWIESDHDGLASTGVITPVAGMVIQATASNGQVYTATTNAAGYYSFTVPANVTYTVHYGSVPASYGNVVASSTPGGNRETGNAGSYQQSGNPDQSHAQDSAVFLQAGEGNWHVDFAFWRPTPQIHLTKYTNGDDADLPTGPTVGVGSVVTWTYAITNTGNVTLTNITLVDDKEGSVTCPQAQLAPGSAMTCILTGTAKAGQYANTAVVTGTPTLGPVTPVTSTNPSHYLGLTAGLGDRVWYDNNFNGVQDLNENGVPNVTVQLLNSNGAVIGTTTTSASGYYSFTNLTPGVYAIRFVTSTLPAGYQLTSLNSGSDTTADSDANPSTGTTTNITLVGNQYDPTWDAGIWRTQPSIVLKKYTNGYDADTITGPYLAVGQVVTWTYTITNTGNVTLTNITLRDNVEGGVTCTPTTLAPGAGTECTQTGIAQAGQYSNTAVVTGTPTLGPVTPVTSTNPSHYFGAKPDVVLKKYTNGYDADTLSDARPHLHLGDPVTWTYVITNTGNVTMSFAANSLHDDKEGVIPHAAFLLLPGESQTLTQHGFVTTVGVYTNIGSIPAIPVVPPSTPPDLPTFPPSNPPSTPITPTNPSHYDAVSAPAIVLRKYTNGYDADTITGPYLPTGSVVTWTYVITNIGNVTLTNVTLTDDKLGGVVCPVTTLAPNATTTCTTTGIAGVGQYTNTAIVTGTNSLTPTQKVTKTNPSHYYGAQPDFVLKKYTNGYDADTPATSLARTCTWATR
ncbi:MAG: SdrD B-like domain-containing protein [Caldilineaceae bacterium]